MGLEVATYISGLNVLWPLAGDTKSQGDDHLRLLKGVLTATFPNASKPFYVPTTSLSASNVIMTASQQNQLVMIDATAGDVTVVLPNGLGSGDAGWACEVVKTNAGGTNAAVVAAPVGNVNSAVGSTASIRIEISCQPVKFYWSGSSWIAAKLGPPIGSSVNWDGAVIPSGYRVADGTTYSAATFPELNAALGTTTLRDKRGRTEAGVDNGVVNRLTATYFGTASLLGAVGGAESNNVLIAHTHTGNTGNDTPDHTHSYNPSNASSGGVTGGGSFSLPVVDTSANSGGASVRHIHPFTTGSAGGAAAHNIVQPTIITNKLIRVA